VIIFTPQAAINLGDLLAKQGDLRLPTSGLSTVATPTGPRGSQRSGEAAQEHSASYHLVREQVSLGANSDTVDCRVYRAR
jgi:hypothetical protein